MDQITSQASKGSIAFLKTVSVIALIGALNWGLVGLFNWNLVDAIFGGGVHEETSAGSRVLYTIVGLCGLASLFLLPAIKGTDTGHRGMPTQRPL